jgi:hypothetical protein
MRLSRSLILVILAGLTLCFLGASYAMWFNTNTFALVNNSDTPTPSAVATTNSAPASHAVRLTVSGSGITSITAAQLRAAGLPFIELAADELNLTYFGQQVPFLVHELDGEPAIFFYAQAPSDVHAPDSVYMLAPGKGVAMSSRSAWSEGAGKLVAQHNLTWEEKRYFIEDAHSEDAWMGPLLLAPDRWPLSLDGIAPDGGPATLILDLFSNVEGPGDPDHHVTVLLNGRALIDHTWDGAGPQTLNIPVPEGLLRPVGDNQLEVVAHNDSGLMGESIYIDGLELIYDGPVLAGERPSTFASKSSTVHVQSEAPDLLVFDITDPDAPQLLTDLRSDKDGAYFDGGAIGREFIALSAAQAQQPAAQAAPAWEQSLLDEERGADYIAIVADVRGFSEALAPLLTLRQEQGFRTAAVPLGQIFDEFGHGHRDPNAIKAFLAYAAANWTPPAPRYILLAGDATHDLTDRAAGRNRNRLPTEMVYNTGSGYLAGDSWFIDFNRDEQAPAMAIGRFPAQNTPQLSTMVEKTLAYELEQPRENLGWANDALLVQDDGPAYTSAAITLAAQLTDGGYNTYRLQTGSDQDIRHSVISALNQGMGYVSYVGPGSESAWGDGSALQNSDVQSLSNGTRLPVLSTFTCRSGSFADPLSDSLAESLLRADNGGIVAAVAPSGRVPSAQQLPLSEAFQEHYLNGGHERLGDVLLGLYDEVQDLPELRAALAPINLLGDPALRLRLPAPR